MTAKRTPLKLGKEPLIDVICGVYFESNEPVDALLPGLLLATLSGKTPKFEPLPVGRLPPEMREGDSNLQQAPLMRIVVDEQFAILIGARWLGVGCQMPYAGWLAYKPMIEKVFKILTNVPSIKNIERLSLKYVDFIEKSATNAPLSGLQLQIDIAGRKITNQMTQIRTEIQDSDFLHAVTILSHATAMRPDSQTRDGIVVDVDTHMFPRIACEKFLVEMPGLLENIHAANKEFFFALLTESGLAELKPIYD